MSKSPPLVLPASPLRNRNCCDWDDCGFFEIVTEGNCSQHCELPSSTRIRLTVDIYNLSPVNHWVSLGLSSHTGNTNIDAVNTSGSRYECEQIKSHCVEDFEFKIWHTSGIPRRSDSLLASIEYFDKPSYCGNSRKQNLPSLSVGPTIEYR